MALEELFVRYLKDAQSLRDNCLDCDNISFQRDNELKLKVPKDWEVHGAIKKALSECGILKVLALYSDTPCYRDIQCVFENDPISYCSFFELQCAIMDSVQDIRPQQRITEQIKESEVVLVFGATRCNPAVRDAIRQFSNGVLIFIE